MFDNALFSVSKEFILQHITQEEIFKRYLGYDPIEGESFVNPKRDDDDAGCSFYIDKRGNWIFVDYAFKYHWDCFNVVEYENNCTFKEALIIIATDFGLLQGDVAKRYLATVNRKPKEKVQLRIKRRDFYKEDIEIWKQWYITEEIMSIFEILPISNAWFLRSGVLIPCYFYTKGDPAYAYHFNGYDYKIYFPNRPKGKKFLQASSNYLQGYNQLPETGTNLLYTKALKCVAAMYNFKNEFDLSCVAPLAETVVIKQDLFTDLYNRFDNQATLFDFDRTGITLARRYEAEYKLPFFFFGKEYRGAIFSTPTGVKDPSDFIKVNGLDKTRKLIEGIIKTI